MKRKFIYLLYILIVGGTLQSCIKYERLTHLSESDLEWVTNRHIGEVMYFQSQNGNRDTIKVWDIHIHNSKNPINWMFFQLGGTEYIASADVELVFNRFSGVMGDFFVIKKTQQEPIFFSSQLLMRWTHDYIPLKITNMVIGDIKMEDIVFVDEHLMQPIHEYCPPNPIVSFAWSKKYGLVQYTFEDGTVFTRTDLE